MKSRIFPMQLGEYFSKLIQGKSLLRYQFQTNTRYTLFKYIFMLFVGKIYIETLSFYVFVVWIGDDDSSAKSA